MIHCDAFTRTHASASSHPCWVLVALSIAVICINCGILGCDKATTLSVPAPNQPSAYEIYSGKIRPFADELLRMQVLLMHPDDLASETDLGRSKFLKEKSEVDYQYQKIETSITAGEKQYPSMTEVGVSLACLNKTADYYNRMNQLSRESESTTNPLTMLNNSYEFEDIGKKYLPESIKDSILSLLRLQNDLKNNE